MRTRSATLVAPRIANLHAADTPHARTCAIRAPGSPPTVHGCALAVAAAIVALLGCRTQPFIYAPPPAPRAASRKSLPRRIRDDASTAHFVEQNGVSPAVTLAAYNDLPIAEQSPPTGEFAADWPADAHSDASLLRLPAVDREPPDRGAPRRLWDDLVDDHRHYYSAGNLGLLAVGSGVAATMANTNVDDFISSDLYQENVRSVHTDEYFEAIHSMKLFGEGAYALPLYGVAVAGGLIADDNERFAAAGHWGERSLRTILVGAPPMLAMQQVIGASRPGEADSRSHWEPFQDDNGVSGHAFMGAVPFLTAAHMTDNPWFRGGFYVGSGMAGLSRINDNHHYASQVALGWWMAYLAARSVNRTEGDAMLQPVVQTTADGFTGLNFEKRW